MHAFQVGDRLLPRFDAVEEVAHVVDKLGFVVAGAVFDGFGAESAFLRRWWNGRPAHGVLLELRDEGGGRNVRVGCYEEPAPRNAQAAFGTEKLQPKPGLLYAARAFAHRVRSRP